MAAGSELGGGVEQAPAEVVITGGAGQIGYQLAPLVASGQTFGEQSVNLRLLELPQAQQAAEGVAAELQDSAYPNLAGVDIYDDPTEAFDGATHVFMVGARPRGKGMERADLLAANGGIFKEQGAALEEASDDVRVLVVGNPANSNALVVAAQVPEIAENGQITAMSRLDHNRAVGMAAAKLGVSAELIDKITIWGNHSNSMVVDTSIAEVDGEPLEDALKAAGVDLKQYATEIKTRGGLIINLRGASSALSAARAASDHMRDWTSNTLSPHSWTSAAVLSQGEYEGLPEGVFASMPVRGGVGQFNVVNALSSVNRADIKAGILATGEELVAERTALQEARFLPK
ncbi:MAG: malate dehydrogenase [Candidatus Saccharimonadales bacterium]